MTRFYGVRCEEAAEKQLKRGAEYVAVPRLGINEEEGPTRQVRSTGNNLDERVTTTPRTTR